MKGMVLPYGRKLPRLLLYITGGLVAVLIAGYFIAGRIIRSRLDEALRALPSFLQVRYASLRSNVFTGSLDLEGVDVRYVADSIHNSQVTVNEVAIRGFSIFAWLTAHRLRVREVRLDQVAVQVDEELIRRDSSAATLKLSPFDGLIGHVEVSGLTVNEFRKGKEWFSLEGELRLDSVTSQGPGEIRLTLANAAYRIPERNESVRLHHLLLDSKKRLARLDTLEVAPDKDKEEIGRLKGHQVDVVRAIVEGIGAEDIDVMGLIDRRLEARQISLRSGRIYVFRDRRLPLEAGQKAMPIAFLESLPVELRVGKVIMGPTRFEYEEHPKVGGKTGILVIERLRGTIEPLLNRPGKGDPAFITITTEGSLMGSGLVTATTRMPLHKNAFYEVRGEFHDLDVTRLNNPAENLGQLHLESGMLNLLDFQFEMGEDRAKGKIVGEYHDLVADKLKLKNGELKKDALKSFALKKLIIPRNKDKSLPVSKRTGKVDYKRDKERYFSYYLLHSLLVGVKSSFSLGFLLPG